MISLELFLQRLYAILNMQTKYRLGYFMNKSVDGHYLVDCSGLIKACIWNYPYDGLYGDIIPDINADTMIKNCSEVSSDFTKIKVGAVVHMSGHIGVHIGKGVVIESTPKWANGVQKTFISGCGYENTQKLNVRKWTKWGLLNYINYGDCVSTQPQHTNKATVINAPNGLRVRTSPVNGEIVKKLSNGTVINIYGNNGSWYMTDNNLWVCGSYLSFNGLTGAYPTGRYYVNCDALIVREKPTTDSRRIPYDELTKNAKEHALSNGCLTYGTAMDVSSVTGNWGKIPSGYVCLDYCRR